MTSRLQPQGPRALGQYGGTQCYGENGAGPRQLTSVLAPTPGGSPPPCGTPGATVVASLTYDDAGRQITDGGRHMTYNGLDQLAAVDLPDGGHVVYAYGYDGQRIRVTDNSGAPPEHWMTPDLREQGGDYDQYVRVGDRVVARVHLHYNPDAPVAAAGLSVTAARAVSALLLLAFGLLALSGMRAAGRGHRLRPALASLLIAALLVPACAPTVGSQSPDLWAPQSITYFHTGFAAGPVLLTDDNGAVLDERRSEPFGQPIDSYSTAGGIKDSIDYTLEPTNILNKPTDARTGWSYHGARWMAPTTARWLTPDPPVKAPDRTFALAPWTLNPYQYVNQNPVLYWDPDGRWFGWVRRAAGIMVKAGGAIAGGVIGAAAGTAEGVIELDPFAPFAGAVGGAFLGAGIASAPGDWIAGDKPSISRQLSDAAYGATGEMGGMVVGRVFWKVFRASRAATAASRSADVLESEGANELPSGEAADPPPFSKQKQAGHVPGTKTYLNRVRTGKSTSTFFDAAQGDSVTLKAWKDGTPLTSDGILRVHDFGRPVGIGPYGGGYQTQVRVSMDSLGRIHGTPYGPIFYGPMPQ